MNASALNVGAALTGVALAIGAGSVCAQATNYPSKSIGRVIALAPGGMDKAIATKILACRSATLAVALYRR